ncbi:MAG: GtrA family protein [Oscillospiraceae bacterium]|nr:GtrA family protein [Oscillospiraceae bacterium]
MTNVNKVNLSETIKEFIRYLFVGGSAFLVDTLVLYITKTYMFNDLGKLGILIATASGFLIGLIYNYFLSIIFVFKKATDNIKGKQIKTFIVFATIGIIGLVLTELGMYFGITIFDSKYYIVVKVFVAVVVLLWNYIARKVLIFK